MIPAAAFYPEMGNACVSGYFITASDTPFTPYAERSCPSWDTSAGVNVQFLYQPVKKVIPAKF
jgi:hypothetical protein